MDLRHRWIARWRSKNGTSREFIFISVESRVIARVDFQLKLIDLQEPVPDEFELEDAMLLALPAAPRLTTLGGLA